MNWKPYRPRPKTCRITKEGHPFIIAGFCVCLFCLFFGLDTLAALAFAFSAFSTYFFRNPERRAPEGDDLVISPADGTVIYIGPAISPLEKKECTKISIFMSVFNVHVNRFPVSGKILQTEYVAGKFFVASLDKACEHNERNMILIEDKKGRHVEAVQIAGLVARRIVTYVKEGFDCIVGDRLGLIRFGSRVDLYLPQDFQVDVSLKQKLHAGETVIGRFR